MASKGRRSGGGGGRGAAQAKASPKVGRNTALLAAAVAAALAFVIGYVVGAGRQDEAAPGEGDVERPEAELFRVPVGDGPTKGPADALVTIVEWSDFECPHCARGAATMDEVFRRFEGKVRLAFRHHPLPSHENAMAAAEASLAAHEQGRFWQYHDLLFANQGELRQGGRTVLLDLARRLDLDMGRFQSALDEGRFRARVLADKRLLQDLGQGGTPMFFVNGRLVRGARPLEDFVALVEAEERRARRLLDGGLERSRLYEELVRAGRAPSRSAGEAARQGEPSEAEPVEVPRNPGGPGLGRPNAPVHVVEFFDFQCPACRAVPPELHKLHEAFPDEVRVEFRQFPLSFHKAARPLAEIAVAAHEQGRYAEVSEALFARQAMFQGADAERGRSIGLEIASETQGVDPARLRRELESGRPAEAVRADLELGTSLPIRATPTVLVNGLPARGRSFERLREQVQAIIAERPRGAAPADAEAGRAETEAGAPVKAGRQPRTAPTRPAGGDGETAP